jgi:hypothetical protein
MLAPEQLTIDHRAGTSWEVDEAAARRSLRAQIAKLERERSALIAGAFPHIQAATTPALDARRAGGTATRGARLLSLEQLERLRDQLAGALQDVRHQVQDRNEHERRAHELLERMKLEPARYKFVRLPVRDLGQGGCGVWEVRPRLGLIGMLAGWWQLKLSSGCPLAGGPRHRPGPADLPSYVVRAFRSPSRTMRRARWTSHRSPRPRRFRSRARPRAGARRARGAGAWSSSRSSSFR